MLKGTLQRLDAYEKLIRLDRPIGILLLLWPTMWGLWLAGRNVPDWRILWIFVLGTVLMRSAGCAINDWADRGFDPHVERTRERPLATGRILPWEALAVAAVLALFSFVMVLAWLNRLTVILAVVAAAFAGIYPFTKRFLFLPQAWLGICFGFGIPMAYSAQLGHVPPEAWSLMAANFFWVMAYDTEYAMVDREDDRRIGIKTSAILFGRFDVAAVMACYLLFFATLGAVGLVNGFGPAFFAGLFAAIVISGYHFMLIRARKREGCFRAFLHNHWIGMAIFAGILVDNFDWQRYWP
jgi:4-hydroxybenzoate polyprenyltransferase